MLCRECLLVFVRELVDAAGIEVTEDTPKAADFVAWNDRLAKSWQAVNPRITPGAISRRRRKELGDWRTGCPTVQAREGRTRNLPLRLPRMSWRSTPR